MQSDEMLSMEVNLQTGPAVLTFWGKFATIFKMFPGMMEKALEGNLFIYNGSGEMVHCPFGHCEPIDRKDYDGPFNFTTSPIW
jgi:hypothetical protein